ncbi:hypothetical protein K431DRAFT_313805 [Polychaeton citri CBS 116435]|uniref:Uncharacterized protein n=1 Tax=Polychaeton citri CBS 116435 TaxID=1314669 RepID=A0A9P4Q3E1_9PEZI|nr:hypothetical protein K431DRAFT_313805 [Polychaeton citri CBS 116435]
MTPSTAFVSLLCLFSLGSSTPVPEPVPETQRSLSIIAKFDDITVLPAVAVTPIGNYDYLAYTNFVVVQQGVSGIQVVGVPAHSGTQVAGFNPTSPGSMDVNYSGSKTQSFDFDSFYFGCLPAELNSLTGTPEDCDVIVTGYKSSRVVAKQTVSFKAKALLQPMTFAQLKGFNSITKATFTVQATLPPAFIMDDVKYVANVKS